MAMFMNPKPAACLLFPFLFASLHAQDADSDTPDDLAANEIANTEVPGEQTVPVAEQGIEDSPDMPVLVETDDELLANEFALLKQLIEDQVLDEADTVAKRVVELTIRIHGPQSNEFARALTNLAIVQYRTKNFDAAQQNFEAAIEIIEDNEDRLNARLVNPLRGLGVSQLESGRPDLATTTFGRAVHVTHVNEGPHNLDQIELLESIAETHLRTGDLEMAKGTQETIYALNIRAYDLDSLELVPALMRRGAWQRHAGFIYDERTTYRRAIRIIEKKSGKNDLQLIDPLIRLGESYFFVDVSGTLPYHEARMSTGEIHFRRAVRIASENPETNWQIEAKATLALGDYYMFEHNPQRGRQVYTDAWTLLSEDESRLDARYEQLEKIVVLRERPLPKYINAADSAGGVQSDDPLLQGHVRLSYEITTRGRADEIKLIEANPPEFVDMQRYVQREIRRRIFRPRFEEAKAVLTPDQQLAHTFFYRQADLDALTSGKSADGKK